VSQRNIGDVSATSSVINHRHLISISGVFAAGPLVAFYDIFRREEYVLFYFSIPDTTREIFCTIKKWLVIKCKSLCFILVQYLKSHLGPKAWVAGNITDINFASLLSGMYVCLYVNLKCHESLNYTYYIKSFVINKVGNSQFNTFPQKNKKPIGNKEKFATKPSKIIESFLGM
jgi:hypothetical protein